MFFASHMHAQEVLLKDKQSISGFFSLEPMVSNYDGNLSYNQIANVAVLINRRFYLGGYGETLLATRSGNLFEDVDCFVPDFGSTGLLIGSIIQPEKLVHFDLRIKMGLGALRLGEDSTISIGNDFISDYEPVFVVQPSAGIEVNITKFFKLNTHIGYRYVGDIDDPVLESDILNGITGQLGLVFGWFGVKKNNEELDEKLMSL